MTGTLISGDTGDPMPEGISSSSIRGISLAGYAQDPSNLATVFAGGESDMNGQYQDAPPVFRQQS